MSERFFSNLPIAGDAVTLGGAEAHHLLHVLRAKVGDTVTLFDDSGAEFTAEVTGRGRAEVELRVTARHEVDRELPIELTVAVALPKGERQKWLVEKLVELGVTALVPLVTERSVAVPSAGAVGRLERSVIEASKQCGRNRLMRISPAAAWREYVSSATADGASRRWIALPGGGSLKWKNLDERLPTCLAIGPEGGWTDGEIQVAVDADWMPVDLGPRILRVETAAVALVSCLICNTFQRER